MDRFNIQIEPKTLQTLDYVCFFPPRVCESMIANCVNQYLNTEYVIKKNGDPNDLINLFVFYYEKIKAHSKVKQMTVIKNCGLLF